MWWLPCERLPCERLPCEGSSNVVAAMSSHLELVKGRASVRGRASPLCVSP
jgi:hypothetical protein